MVHEAVNIEPQNSYHVWSNIIQAEGRSYGVFWSWGFALENKGRLSKWFTDINIVNPLTEKAPVTRSLLIIILKKT